jgi:hypothetical protein
MKYFSCPLANAQETHATPEFNILSDVKFPAMNFLALRWARKNRDLIISGTASHI